MVAICICLLNVIWFTLDLLGHPVTAHFDIPRSIPTHSQYLSIIFSCGCIDVSLLVMVAKSYAYAIELIVNLDVPKVYPYLLFCSHLSSDSRNIIKMYGLRVSPCIIPI